MKYIILIIVFATIFAPVYSQKNIFNESDYILIKIDSFNNHIDRAVYVYKYDTARKMRINYWENGKLMGKGFSNKGKLDGELKIYDYKGKLMAIDSFANGIKLSSKKFYIQDTSIKVFKKGKLEPFISIDSIKQ